MDGLSDAGGFIPPLSPPASVASQTAKLLPEARHTLLKRGSQKEAKLFQYLDTTLDKIEGKVERRLEAVGGNQTALPSNVGYHDFAELAVDLNSTIDVIWVSGTPSIQIPFLLSVAGRTNEYMSRFKFTPKKLFPLLTKLDIIFASLLSGVDYESKLPLPNVNSLTMNVTEKVRLRSIVESGRIATVHAFQKASRSANGMVTDVTDTEATATETEGETEDDVGRFFVEREDVDDWSMDSSTVYQRTLEHLGSLDTDPIGNYDDYAARPPADS